MKRILSTLIVLSAAMQSFGQTMQASIGAGSSATRVILYVKPTAAVNGTISTLQFTVAIDAAVTPVPSVAVVGTPAFGVTWHIDPPYTEAGYLIYDFTTAASPAVVIASGAETPVMEIEFSGGPAVATNVLLLTLPAGGATTGNTLFFCSGAATSVEGQLYYTRAGTTVVNNNSYTGALNSTATVGTTILPLNWLSFNVVKQGNDGLLSWAVANEDDNHHYELQRSTNGTNFTAINSINKSVNGNTVYNYTDANINILGASILYYRIKQVDINGRTSFSDTRTLRLDNKENGITVFPNPVKDGFYISIPLSNAGNHKVKLSLTNASGQLIGLKEITAAQATNYYFDISNKTIAAGNYNLQIILGEEIIGTKKLY
ncbi:MAG: T9SS type A sorting domain-containing protein, partial [Ferruginibacter sp.]